MYNMALLVLLGYLVCNVLIAWLHYNNPIYLKPYHYPHHKIQIIGYIWSFFEPQPKIQLTCSSYKVTSFLDFQPFLQGLQSVNEYLDDLMTDIDNPTYYQRLISPFRHVQITPLSNDTHIMKFLSSPACNSTHLHVKPR